MPRKSPKFRQTHDRVNFDINRSSYYRHVRAERDEIKRHQREVSAECGEEIEYNEALMSWVRQHRWEWADQRAKRLK